MMTEMPVKLNKFIVLCAVTLTLVLFLTVNIAPAKGKDKGLDEEVQDLKGEVLSIAKGLDQLEAQLLYPSHTQISVFVALRDSTGFRLDSIDIVFDGRAVEHHLYSAEEREALVIGGVQKIYTGNVAVGKHELKVTMRGQSASGDKVKIEKKFPVVKTDKAGIAELLVSEKTITLINR